jgi:hypothetical protein
VASCNTISSYALSSSLSEDEEEEVRTRRSNIRLFPGVRLRPVLFNKVPPVMLTPRELTEFPPTELPAEGITSSEYMYKWFI